MPRTAFHTVSGASTQGLKAEYFSNSALSGKPVGTRIDPQTQFDWNSAAPAKGVPIKAFAVRWTGTLTPPGEGNYTFKVLKPEWHPDGGKDVYRIYLDAKSVLNSTPRQALDYHAMGWGGK